MTEAIQEKWKPIIEAEGVDAIKSTSMKNLTIQVLENMVSEVGNDAASVITGTGDGSYAQNGVINPVLISLVRRAMPALIANDLVGVQPMSMPTGLIFAMRSYRDAKGTGTETFVPGVENPTLATVTTAAGEVLGTETTNATTAAYVQNEVNTQLSPWTEVSFGIEKTSVEAKTRAMKASYTMELAQDLKAQHGLDAETELANLLTQEVLTEMNREIVTLIGTKATTEAMAVVASTPFAVTGEYDVDLADGRWAAEKYRMLAGYISRVANHIALSTGRGQGNFIITSPDVANALEIAGTLTSAPIAAGLDNVSGIGVTLAGSLFGGRIKVYVDQYNTTDEVICGYKGSSSYDAGIFYCPYVPLQMMKAQGPDDFQPRIGFKSRYGLADNPFGANTYYRKFVVKGLSGA
jgi:hypothetical protein